MGLEDNLEEIKPNKSNSYGIASLVCGVIGLPLSWFPVLGLALPILAIYFKGQQDKISSNGLSAVGNILGIIGLVIGLFMTLLMIIFWVAFPETMTV